MIVLTGYSSTQSYRALPKSVRAISGRHAIPARTWRRESFVTSDRKQNQHPIVWALNIEYIAVLYITRRWDGVARAHVVNAVEILNKPINGQKDVEVAGQLPGRSPAPPPGPRRWRIGPAWSKRQAAVRTEYAESAVSSITFAVISEANRTNITNSTSLWLYLGM